MNCPKCGAGTEVVDSRDDVTVLRRRVRKCSHGHRFTTYEVPAAELNGLRTSSGMEPLHDPTRAPRMNKPRRHNNSALFKS